MFCLSLEDVAVQVAWRKPSRMHTASPGPAGGGISGAEASSRVTSEALVRVALATASASTIFCA